MVIAITGAKGLLGKYLVKEQPSDEFDGIVKKNVHNVIGLERKDLDVSNFSQVLEVLFKIQPDVIIHCACNGDVDDVENNSSKAVQTDLLGVINLKTYAERMGCKLITISSNAVYDGKNPPYKEGDIHNPVNFYGKIKSLADEIIVNSACDWLIIRPILMYGWGEVRDNWPTKIIKNLQDKKPLSLVIDSFTQPTYAGDVAKAIWHLIERDRWKETFNVASEEQMSLYYLGIIVCKVFGLDSKLLSQAKLSDFKSIAPRPLNTCFDVSKLNATGFKCTEITKGLTKMKNE